MPNNTFLWTLSALAGSLLLFTRQLDGPEPPRALCRAQSAIVLAQPPGMSAAALTVVWKVWSLTWSVRTNAIVSKEPLWLSSILLGTPWVIWIVFSAIFAAVQNKSRVYRSSFYCTSDNQTLGTVSGAVTAIFLILCLLFQFWTVILVYRRFRKSRRLGRAEVGDVSVPFLARIVAFALFILVALVLSFIATSVFALDVPDIIIASIGGVIFLIFASQQDVLVSWGIMRSKPHVETHLGTTSTEAQVDQSSHEERPPLSPTPFSPLQMSLGPSQTSSALNLAASSRNKRQLTIQVDQTELSSTKHRFETSFGDIESVGTASSSPAHA